MVGIPDLSTRLASSDAWVAAARGLVDSQLSDIPGIIDDAPWSSRSLNSAENHLLSLSEQQITPELVERYMQFLGEGLLRTFNGVWVKISPEVVGLSQDDGPALGIAYDTSPDQIDIMNSVVALARTFGTGTYWSSIFEGTAAVLKLGTSA